MWHDCSSISSVLMIAIILAPQVIALAPRAPFSHILLSRQVTSGTVCASACSVFENALTKCGTAACLCTTSVANGLQSCVNCAVSASPTSDVISSAQDLVSKFQSACSGISLPSISVPSGSSTSGGSSGGSTSKSVTVPSTSKSATGTSVISTPSTTIVPLSTTGIVQSTASTAIIVTSVTDISTPAIVQTTIHPSTITGPATGPTTSTAATSGATSVSAHGLIVVGLHVVMGCILGISAL